MIESSHTPTMLTTLEAARQLGVSEATFRARAARLHLTPETRTFTTGRRRVTQYRWTRDDLARVQADLSTRPLRSPKAAKKAVETKRAKLMAAIEVAPIAVSTFPIATVYERAVAHYNERALDRRHDDHAWACLGSDPAFLARITVNFIRHCLTSYDAELDGLARRVGRSDAEFVWRERIYDAIAEAYPELADECARQAASRRWLELG